MYCYAALTRALLVWTVVWLILLHPLTAEAEEDKRRGPLKDLPGPPGPHIAKIKAMGDNSWLDLGQPDPDPQYGRGQGRAYSSRMAYAPGLRGAFLFGEGVHGKATIRADKIYYNDDLFLYDINAHRWICAYPGTDTADYHMIINADGFEATPDGKPKPVASMAHAYGMITYDTHKKRFISMPCPGSYWHKRLPLRSEFLKNEDNKKRLNHLDRNSPIRQASPWMFNTVTGEWERYKTNSKSPAMQVGHTILYIPTIRKVFSYGAGMHYYDTEKNDWEIINAQGPAPIAGWDAISCYDSKRDRIYIGGGNTRFKIKEGNTLWIFDVKTNTWIDPNPTGELPSPYYSTQIASMNYDTANDVVILFLYNFSEINQTRGVYAYDPEKNTWSLVNNQFPQIWDNRTWQRSAVNTFYDPELNVHFCHVAGDSAANGVMIAYRYKKR